ncbi:unnamed protein product, partial [Didymodactylos carnosus]
YAVENGKSFFDVLFDKEGDLHEAQSYRYPPPPPFNRDEFAAADNNKDSKAYSKTVGETQLTSKAERPSTEYDFKPTPERLSKTHKQKDITTLTSPTNTNNNLNKEKIDSSSNASFVDRIKNKFRRTSSGDDDNTGDNHERLSQPSAVNNQQNVTSDPRMCTLITRPGTDGLGIYLQPDKDFGHIVIEVEQNSPADLAGIEKDDCILSLNDTPVIKLPYAEVLALLKKNKNEHDLNFLVAKKSYLLKSDINNTTLPNTQHDRSHKYSEDQLQQQSSGEVLPSSNLPTSSAAEALEQLIQKYTSTTGTASPDSALSADDGGRRGKRETVPTNKPSTTGLHEQQQQQGAGDLVNQGSRVSTKPNTSSNQQKHPGQIIQGVGPATQDGSSWSNPSSIDDIGKTTGTGRGGAITSLDSSIRSTSPDRKREQKQDTEDHMKYRPLEDDRTFKPLQVGITNPADEQNRMLSSFDQSPVGKTGTQSSQSSTGALPGTHQDSAQRTARTTILPETDYNTSKTTTRGQNDKMAREDDLEQSEKQTTPPLPTKKYSPTGDSFNEETNKLLSPQISSLKQATKLSPDTSLGNINTPEKQEDIADYLLSNTIQDKSSSVVPQPSSQTYQGKTYANISSALLMDDTDDDLSDISERSDEDEISDTTKMVVHSDEDAFLTPDKMSDFFSTTEDENQSEISTISGRKKKQRDDNNKLLTNSSLEKPVATLSNDSMIMQKPIDNNLKSHVHFTTQLGSDEIDSDAETVSPSPSSVEEKLPAAEYLSANEDESEYDQVQQQTTHEINKTVSDYVPAEKSTFVFTENSAAHIVNEQGSTTMKRRAPSPPSSVTAQDTSSQQNINVARTDVANNLDQSISNKDTLSRSAELSNDNDTSDDLVESVHGISERNLISPEMKNNDERLIENSADHVVNEQGSTTMKRRAPSPPPSTTAQDTSSQQNINVARTDVANNLDQSISKKDTLSRSAELSNNNDASEESMEGVNAISQRKLISSETKHNDERLTENSAAGVVNEQGSTTMKRRAPSPPPSTTAQDTSSQQNINVVRTDVANNLDQSISNKDTLSRSAELSNNNDTFEESVESVHGISDRKQISPEMKNSEQRTDVVNILDSPISRKETLPADDYLSANEDGSEYDQVQQQTTHEINKTVSDYVPAEKSAFVLTENSAAHVVNEQGSTTMKKDALSPSSSVTAQDTSSQQNINVARTDVANNLDQSISNKDTLSRSAELSNDNDTSDDLVESVHGISERNLISPEMKNNDERLIENSADHVVNEQGSTTMKRRAPSPPPSTTAQDTSSQQNINVARTDVANIWDSPISRKETLSVAEYLSANEDESEYDQVQQQTTHEINKTVSDYVPAENRSAELSNDNDTSDDLVESVHGISERNLISPEMKNNDERLTENSAAHIVNEQGSTTMKRRAPSPPPSTTAQDTSSQQNINVARTDVANIWDSPISRKETLSADDYLSANEDGSEYDQVQQQTTHEINKTVSDYVPAEKSAFVLTENSAAHVVNEQGSTTMKKDALSPSSSVTAQDTSSQQNINVARTDVANNLDPSISEKISVSRSAELSNDSDTSDDLVESVHGISERNLISPEMKNNEERFDIPNNLNSSVPQKITVSRSAKLSNGSDISEESGENVQGISGRKLISPEMKNNEEHTDVPNNLDPSVSQKITVSRSAKLSNGSDISEESGENVQGISGRKLICPEMKNNEERTDVPNNLDPSVSQKVTVSRPAELSHDSDTSEESVESVHGISERKLISPETKSNEEVPTNDTLPLASEHASVHQTLVISSNEKEDNKSNFESGKETDLSKQKIPNATSSSAKENESDSDNTMHSERLIENQQPIIYKKMELAKMPLSELQQRFELHNIQLMQPTETSPVGLKLSKQADPLQFIITAVAKDTKADLAGLQVNDWLIKIGDRDIREKDFGDVSQEIRRLLTDEGTILMVVAREKQQKPITQTSSGTIPRSTDRTAARQQQSTSKQTNVPPIQPSNSLLTTDITRDTPDNTQVRFRQDISLSPPSQRRTQSPDGTFHVGLTNPLTDETSPTTKSPRSLSNDGGSRSHSQSPPNYSTERQARSTTKPAVDISRRPDDQSSQVSEDPADVRVIQLKEASGLDFNSFIPDGDSAAQTHFISNVQSMAENAGLRDGDRIIEVNGVDVTDLVHEDVRKLMQHKKPLILKVVYTPKYLEFIQSVELEQSRKGSGGSISPPVPTYEQLSEQRTGSRPLDSQSGNERTRSPSHQKSSKNDYESEKKNDVQDEIDDDEQQYETIVVLHDDNGELVVKHCHLRKSPTYNGYGLLLRYQHSLHLIDQVEPNSPAYFAGLRENDIILFVNGKNVEKLTHDDVKILIRSLSLSNTDINLILMNKNDIPRYKQYQEQNTIDWPTLLNNSTKTSNINESEFKETVPNSSPPSSPSHMTSNIPLPTGARLCKIYPTSDHTAGFALSGVTGPPFLIYQIEPNSPASMSGLLLNDALLYVNQKPVADTAYPDVVKTIKEALKNEVVELIVKATADDTESINEDDREGKYSENGDDDSIQNLRLCHLHTNGDTSATFGFGLSEINGVAYPIIQKVEPNSPAEYAGLLSNDILLEVNERKTKNLGYDKVKKLIDKAKRDGRLDLLVSDQQTYDYCKTTKKKLSPPDIIIRHVFPKIAASHSSSLETMSMVAYENKGYKSIK